MKKKTIENMVDLNYPEKKKEGVMETQTQTETGNGKAIEVAKYLPWNERKTAK
jgi:hypothetical protein